MLRLFFLLILPLSAWVGILIGIGFSGSQSLGEYHWFYFFVSTLWLAIALGNIYINRRQRRERNIPYR